MFGVIGVFHRADEPLHLAVFLEIKLVGRIHEPLTRILHDGPGDIVIELCGGLIVPVAFDVGAQGLREFCDGRYLIPCDLCDQRVVERRELDLLDFCRRNLDMNRMRVVAVPGFKPGSDGGADGGVHEPIADFRGERLIKE